ncbi:MAG: outer membrane lipoprotein carrier protein LolA [Candidatus Acidiferrales bacterium]
MSSASSNDAHSVVRALEVRYQHAQTLSADFYERYSDGNGGDTAESGVVYFSRPGRMRWEYESPETKLFVVDGTNVWFYVPADRTASRAKVKESSDWRTPLALLTGKANFARLCRTIDVVDQLTDANLADRPTGAEDIVLRCLPRGGADDAGEDIREVLLESDPGAHLVRIVIRQPGNLQTEFRFGNWKENVPIPESQFHFLPPPGVAIVDEATLAGSIH